MASEALSVPNCCTANTPGRMMLLGSTQDAQADSERNELRKAAIAILSMFDINAITLTLDMHWRFGHFNIFKRAADAPLHTFGRYPSYPRISPLVSKLSYCNFTQSYLMFSSRTPHCLDRASGRGR